MNNVLTIPEGSAEMAITGEYDEMVGMLFGGDGLEKHLREFWEINMPCGEKYVYAINEVPTENVPCRCGDPKHWAVKYERGGG